MHYLFTYRFKENFIAFFFFFCAVFAAMRRIKRKLKLTANEIGMGDETDTIIKYLSCFFLSYQAMLCNYEMKSVSSHEVSIFL